MRVQATLRGRARSSPSRTCCCSASPAGAPPHLQARATTTKRLQCRPPRGLRGALTIPRPPPLPPPPPRLHPSILPLAWTRPPRRQSQTKASTPLLMAGEASTLRPGFCLFCLALGGSSWDWWARSWRRCKPCYMNGVTREEQGITGEPSVSIHWVK